MKLIQATTAKGSLTNCSYVEDNGNSYCFSYGELVAAVVDGEYIEFNGPMYYSRTSNRHKSQFRKYYGVRQ